MGYSPASEPRRIAAWATRQIQAEQATVLADFMACAAFDLRDRVGAIEIPTTIISAADDRLTPPKLQSRLQRLIPRSRIQSVPRAGHFLIFERPDVVAGVVTRSGQNPPLFD